jgi:hypothetical protein
MPTAGTETIAGTGKGLARPKSWEPSLRSGSAAAFLVCDGLSPRRDFKASLWDEKAAFTTSGLHQRTYLAAITCRHLFFWVGLISVVIGGLFAWLVTRTDHRGKPFRAGDGLVVAPPFLGAFAWTLLAT